MKRTVIPVLLLSLAACAPTQGRAGVSALPTFRPGGQELAQICAGKGRVAVGGVLRWDNGGVQQVRLAPYLVSCYDYTLKNDGATISVQDDTLVKALTHFDRDASFLKYATDRSVRLPTPGTASADPSGAVTITASQPGQPEVALLKGGTATPLTYDPGKPLTLRLAGDRVVWPEVTVEATKGLITAPIYRQ